MPEEAKEKENKKEKESEKKEQELEKEANVEFEKNEEKLLEELNKVKEEMSIEQNVVTAKVKQLTARMRESDSSVLDELKEVDEIFKNYNRLFELKKDIKNKYFTNLRNKSKKSKNKRTPHTKITKRIPSLRELPTASDQLPQRTRSLQRPCLEFPFPRLGHFDFHFRLLQPDSRNLLDDQTQGSR